MDELRNAVIEIGWRINTRELERANVETDSMIDKASQAENGFRKTSKSVDGAASSLVKNSKALEVNTSNVLEFGRKSQRTFGETKSDAESVNSKVKGIGTEFKSSGSAARDFNSQSKNGLSNTQREADDATKKVRKIGDEFDSSSDSARVFGSKGSKNVKEVGASADESRGKLERLADTSDKVSQRVSDGFNKAKLVVAALGGAAIVAGKNAFEAASDYNEAANKVEVAFGDNNDSVKKWSETTRKEIGLARGTALDLAAGYGDMATSMEIGTDEAANMSMSMVNLAADLASFKNKDMDQINTALNGVFTGEGEALKGLGIVMTQANLEQFALSQGMLDTSESAAQATKKAIALEKAEKAVASAVKKHGEDSLQARDARNKLALVEEKANEQASANLSTLSQAEQVRLRYNYLMSKTTNAQGDFARNSTEAANAQRIFSETVKETSDKIGQKLLPIFTPMILKATEFVEKGEMIPELFEKAKNSAEPFVSSVMDNLGKAKDYFVDDFLPTAQMLGEEMGPGFMDGAKKAFETVGWTVDNIIKPPLEWLKDYAVDHPELMRDVAKWAAYGITGILGFSVVSSPIFKIVGKVNSLRQSIEKIGDSAIISAGKAKLGFETINKSVPTSLPDTPTQQPASLLDEAGELIQSRSDRHKKNPSKVGKAANWLFNGASTAEKATEQTLPAVARHAGKVTLGARAAGTVSSGLNLAKGAAKGVAKAVPGVSLIAAATNLIGMNKDNVGDKVGGSIGTMIGGAIGTKAATLAGAKFGALAGTIFGPVGTAVGGVLGTGIGVVAGSTIGKSIGSNIGKSIQNDWPAIEKKVKVLWEGLKKIPMFAPITIPIEANIKGIKAGIDGAKKLIDGTKEFFADPFEGAGEIEKTKGVSKETTKEVNKYLENYNEVSYASAKIKITGEPLTKQEFNDLMKSYDEMRDQVVDALEDRASKSTKNLDRLLELGVIDKDTIEKSKKAAEEQANANIKAYEEANNKIKALEKKRNDEVTKINEEAENKINQIREKARKENRELTDSENRQIEDIERGSKQRTAEINQTHEKVVTVIHENMKENAVTAMSDSAKEQEIILGNLKNSAGELSAKQAASVVENSYKAKEETIKNANDKYEETKRILDEERYVSGTISQEKYEEALRIAKDERDGVVKNATETHDEVVSKAKSQASGHIEQVNWETGETLSKWDVFKNDFSAKATEIADGARATWKRLASGTSEWFGKAGDWAVGEWNSFMTDLSIVVNKIIDGINAPLKFFGAKGMQHWTPTSSSRANASGYKVADGGGRLMAYKGNRDSYSGPALVGEEGVELAYNKTTSTMRLLGANGPEVTHVAAAEHILPHGKTMAVLNGGLGAGTTLPGFHGGKGCGSGCIHSHSSTINNFRNNNGLPGFSDGKGDHDEVEKSVGEKLLDGAKDVGSKIAGGAETVMNWITDPVGEIKALVDKHNKFKDGNNLAGFGFKAVTKVADVAKEWAKSKFSEFSATFMSSGSHDGSMGGEGVYKYLYDIAVKTMTRYPGMSITSGYRPGDPYSHGKHQAIDIAYPASMNGSSKYMAPANWVFENFPQEIAYVITLGQVRDRSGMSGTGSSSQWTRWPDNDHYDHLHINGALGSGEIKTGANTGVMGGAKIPGGSGVSRWSGLATQALMMENVFTPLNLAAMLNQIRTESSGNPSTINNWDDNAKRGTPSKGLLQVIDPTFQTYKRPGYNDIWDPLSNMLASIRYVKATYGSITNGYRGVGYENGGFITHEHQATVGEGNKPEVVIPLSSAKRPRGESLLQRTAEIFGLGLKNKEMSNSAKEQEIILGNLKNTAGELSAKQAASIVESSYKAKEESIKNANDKYEETKRILDEERYVSGTISEEKYNEAIRIAQQERDGVIKEATTTHHEVVSQAKQQTTGHLEQVNWETGETLSGWERLAGGTAKWFSSARASAWKAWDALAYDLQGTVNGIIKGINIPLKFFSGLEIPLWNTRTVSNNYKVSNASTGSANNGNFTVGRTLYKGNRDSYSGPALVGEEGVELAYNKTTSSMRLLGSNGPEVTHVSANEHILPHHKTKAILNGGLGTGTVLPGFHDGKGDHDEVEKSVGEKLLDGAKNVGGNVVEGAKNFGAKVAEGTANVVDWLTNPVGQVKALIDKHNIFKKGDNLAGYGWAAVQKVGDAAKEWVKNKVAEIQPSFGDSGFYGDTSKNGNGVYQYLMNIANGFLNKYKSLGLYLSSGLRFTDNLDHSKGLAVDLAISGVNNGSPIYRQIADAAINMEGVKYVITNGMWRHKGQPWVTWPDGEHYDHVHISGNKPSGPRYNAGTQTQSSQLTKSSYGGGDIVDRAMLYSGPIVNPAEISFYTSENNAMEGGPLNAMGGYLKMDDIAVDRNYHQLGNYIKLNGQNFHAVDVGGAIKGPRRFDVFVGGSQARASSLGRRIWNYGFRDGGWVTRDGIYRMGEDNKNEVVVPVDKPSRAKELVGQIANYIGMDWNAKPNSNHENSLNPKTSSSKAQKAMENIHTSSTTEKSGRSFNIFGKETKPSIDFHPTIQVTVQSNGNEGSNIEERVKKAVKEATDAMLEQFSSLLLRGEI